MGTSLALYILASAFVFHAVANLTGKHIMSAATDRLSTSLAANTASQEALRAALTAAVADNGDAAANAAADALDAETAKNTDALGSPPAA